MGNGGSGVASQQSQACELVILPVARGGIEPPTFRFSVEDCGNIATVAKVYVSQGVWPHDTYQQFATIIGVSRVFTTSNRQSAQGVASFVVMIQPPQPPSAAGWTQPPLRPGPPEERPATRGDIAAVVDELREIRGVLEEIRELLRYRGGG